MFLRLASFFLFTTSPLLAQNSAPADAKPVIEKAIAAIGGEEKIFRLFRIKERFNFGNVLAEVDKASSRDSVMEPPLYWWVGGVDRTDEPAKFDLWGWTLGALVDPESIVEVIPEVIENEKPSPGLRVSGTIDPAMDLYFDPANHRLIRIDWRGDIYHFSEWKEYDGTGYHAKTVMFKINAKEPWLFHEILELERLSELPEGLDRLEP
jgi:hypothetical protein